MVFMLAPNYHV